MAAYEALEKGQEIRRGRPGSYSDDPSVKRNGAGSGISPFSLFPMSWKTWPIRCLPGSSRSPFAPKAVIIFFAMMAKERRLGRIKVAQILLPFPPSATPGDTGCGAEQRADSRVYAAAERRGFRHDMARTYSGDNLSYQSGGELPEFGIGKYDSAFEATALRWTKMGRSAAPFASAYGYHIIKRSTESLFRASSTSRRRRQMKQQVLNDPRIEVSRQALAGEDRTTDEFSTCGFPEMISGRLRTACAKSRVSSFRGLSYSTVLFSFDQRQSYIAEEWLDYSRTIRGQRAGGSQADKDLFERWIERMAMDYYRNHLELHNRLCLSTDGVQRRQPAVRDHATKDLGQGLGRQRGIEGIIMRRIKTNTGGMPVRMPCCSPVRMSKWPMR
jgi:peptidyl-prolyl cis-trans isomerase SurA